MIEVTLNDRGIPLEKAYQHFEGISEWAKKNCPSYQLYEDMDVSDFSTEYDTVAVYVFGDEKDAMLFTLRWK